MMTAFQLLIQALHAEVLRPAGYRKKGSLFRKASDEVWQMVEFQRSRRSTADVAYFTINLGVCLKSLFPHVREPQRPPRIEDCHWRERIGFVLGKQRDVWWTVAGGNEVEHLTTVLTGMLTDTALPALQTYCDEKALIDLWTSGESPGLTALQREEFLRALFRRRQ